MDITGVTAFCGIVLLAAVVQGVSGFAFGMVVLMVFPYLFGYTSALMLATMLALILNTANAYIYRNHINWHWIPRWMVVFTVMDLISVLVLKNVGDSPIWYTLMGAMFILMACYLLWGQRVLHITTNNRSMFVLASLNGLIMGAFGVGGPIMAAFLLQATEHKEEYLGTSQALGAFVLGVDFIMRAINGMFSLSLLGYSGIGLIFIVIGLLIAKCLVSHMNALTMRRIICGVMVLNGIVMLSH